MKKSTARATRAFRGRALVPEAPTRSRRRRARGAAPGVREYTENGKRYRVVNGRRVRVKSAARQAAIKRNPYFQWMKANRSRVLAGKTHLPVAQQGKILGAAYRAAKGRA